MRKKTLTFENFSKTGLTLECITAFIAHLEGFGADFGRKLMDFLEIDYPLWFANQENYEPGDEISKMAETMLDLKEDVKLRTRVKKEEVIVYILIKDSHPNVF